MFKQGWTPYVTPGQLTSPPSVMIQLQASPKWVATRKQQDLDLVGKQVIDSYSTLLASWVAGQRQNAHNANLPIFIGRLQLPYLYAEYCLQNGMELVRLVVQPQNTGGTIPTSITSITGDELVVQPEFIGYPIPGAEGLQGDISGGCAWWNGQDYFYEFASTPGWPTDEYSNTPLMRNSDPFNIDKLHLLPGRLVMQQYGNFYTDFDNSPIDAHGFKPNLWQHIGAGSKLVRTPIKDGDMVYFEVRIDKLNTSVPDACSAVAVGNVADPRNFKRNELIYWDTSIHTRFYPKELNTWWTPAIGILPESMVKDDIGRINATTPALLGMELDMTAPRSVYTVRTSYMTIHTHNQQYQIGAGYYGVPVDPVHGVLTVLNLNVNPPLGPLLGTVVQFAPSAGVGGSITLPGDHWYGLPDNYDITVHYQAPYIQSEDTEELGGDILPSGYTGDPATDALTPSMPLHATDGVYSPCLKGRADNRSTPLPSDDYPLQTNANAFNGVFSGVELGEWQEKDIIRVAVDARHGYVWFGRNDHWYYMRDQAAVQADKGDDLPGKTKSWALVLDKDPVSGKYPNYYAAVSWRVGGMKATILTGSSQRYATPAGFKPLTSTPGVIPTGDQDDPNS